MKLSSELSTNINCVALMTALEIQYQQELPEDLIENTMTIMIWSLPQIFKTSTVECYLYYFLQCQIIISSELPLGL